MFFKLSVLTFVVPLVSALTLNTPTDWTSQGDVQITWTNAAGDPPTWSFELINQQFNNAFAIANNVVATDGKLNLTLPVVPVGPGYTVEAVALNNISDVFASTGSFSIGAATTAVVSSTSVTATGTGSVPPFTPITTSGFGTTASGTTTPANKPPGTSSVPTSTATGFNSAASALKFSFASLNAVGAVAVMLLAAIAGGAVVLV